MTRIILSLILVVVLGLSVYQGVSMVQPTTMTTLPTKETGYLNVQKALSIIAAKPHPTVSTQQEQIRRYLLTEIQAMGYHVIEQPFLFTIDELVARQEKIYSQLDEYQRRAFDAELARVGAKTFEEEVRIRSGLKQGNSAYGTNIIAKRTSPAAKNTILIVAHYDSVGTSPGAGDDGMAVASMLQLMRDLTQVTTIKNNVIFLLTDGEELGLLGANYFANQLTDEELQSISLVLNFEARGNHGIPVLFETSAQPYALMTALNKNLSNVTAFSFTPLIYDILQNDTDYTVFKEKGIAGLNFAVVQGFEHYHRMSDTLENLSPETLFQYQNTVRKVGYYFIVQQDMELLGHNKDAVYFPLPIYGLVIIPSDITAVLGISILILCLFWGKHLFHHQMNRNVKKSYRQIPFIFIGLLCAIISIKIPALSYLITIPCLFLLISHIILFKFNRFYLALIITTLGIYFSSLLYTPVVYLINSGLQSLLFAFIIALIPTIIWSINYWCLWRAIPHSFTKNR
ncbi:M28 family metallopeptidase [Xenorhabdus ehlersii]|uniref:Aminopeptidase YwaD n=1 Tax=Xenorhabdus ehlersii TaxID=290111 RepID=A0A2D0IUR7_9GAMM|nr:M28 family metallopeptidase [Xenorhabdus ehlersii]PHM25654.1 Aminopeptidase YwaD [Xenorhabdus ehlersii]RKE93477.1 peptidase M28-like protein [Xenorhabdus ehlersii]